MKIYGEIGIKHYVQPKYESWGMVGSLKVIENLEISRYSNVLKFIDKMQILHSDYKLVSAIEVKHFISELKEITSVVVRFIPSFINASKLQYGGEHISFVYDIEGDRLLGMTNMTDKKHQNVPFLSHEVALKKAIDFLYEIAPDLMETNDQEIELIEIDNGDRMIFSPSLKIGKIEVNWIDVHEEFFLKKDDINKTIVDGLKVKMYIPDTNLWVWVIIDRNGEVQTFERDISWDFSKMERCTQMWLHDEWIQLHFPSNTLVSGNMMGNEQTKYQDFYFMNSVMIKDKILENE